MRHIIARLEQRREAYETLDTAASTVRVVDALIAIRIHTFCGPLVSDCPLCPGPIGRSALEISVAGLRCTSGSPHSSKDLARLLLAAARRKRSTADPDDSAILFCLRLLRSRRRRP